MHLAPTRRVLVWVHFHANNRTAQFWALAPMPMLAINRMFGAQLSHFGVCAHVCVAFSMLYVCCYERNGKIPL